MSMYYHTRQQVVQGFFSKRFDFPGKRQELDSFVYSPCLKKTSQDKIVSQIQVSVAKWLSLQVFVFRFLSSGFCLQVLSSGFCFNRMPPCQRFESLQCPLYLSFFSLIFNQSTVSQLFIADLSYFTISGVQRDS